MRRRPNSSRCRVLDCQLCRSLGPIEEGVRSRLRSSAAVSWSGELLVACRSRSGGLTPEVPVADGLRLILRGMSCHPARVRGVTEERHDHQHRHGTGSRIVRRGSHPDIREGTCC